MCKQGDIIRINDYISEDGISMKRHSFIVIEDEGGTISGLSYDFVATVMSSIKDEVQKKKKLRYIESI